MNPLSKSMLGSSPFFKLVLKNNTFTYQILTSRRSLITLINRFGSGHPLKSKRIQLNAQISVNWNTTPQNIRRWQCFSNDRIIIVARPKCFIAVCTLYSFPWKVDICVSPTVSARECYFQIIEPILLSLQKRSGVVAFHASAVESFGKALLFIGKSGSGKSSTALSLGLSGFNLLADDEAFLKLTRHGVTVSGVERDSYVDRATLRRLNIPIPKSGPRTTMKKGKFAIRLQDSLRPNRFSARLAAVFFPRIVNSKTSTITPLSKPVIIERLMQLEPKELKALVPDSMALKNQLDLFGHLANSARCFDLALGKEPIKAKCFLKTLKRPLHDSISS